MDREDALDAVALERLADGDGGGDAGLVDANDDALVRLHARLVALDDGHADPHRHAHPEGDKIVLHLRRVHPLHVLHESLAGAAGVAAGANGEDLEAATAGGDTGVGSDAGLGGHGAARGERDGGLSGATGRSGVRQGKGSHGGGNAGHL